MIRTRYNYLTPSVPRDQRNLIRLDPDRVSRVNAASVLFNITLLSVIPTSCQNWTPKPRPPDPFAKGLHIPFITNLTLLNLNHRQWLFCAVYYDMRDGVGLRSSHHIAERVLSYAGSYSRLSLSRILRDSLKHFKISVPRYIRVERVRKQ